MSLRTLRLHLMKIALLNTHSIENKALTLGDFFITKILDFMYTWQREEEYFLLNELCPPDCSMFGTPRLEWLLNPDSFI